LGRVAAQAFLFHTPHRINDMEKEIDRAQLLADGVRRQLVGTLGLATLGIATLGLCGLCRVIKDFTALGDCGSEFDRKDRLDELDEGGGRTLYEIVYYDRRLGSYWPVGSYPEFSGVVDAAPPAQAAQGERPK
jgi:hypothetical protein